MISLDKLFEILSEQRRRYVLYYLEQRDGPVSVDELVTAVAKWEDDSSVEIPDEKFERVEISLQHNHLPKTAEVEYVQYDPDEKVIQVSESPPELDAFLTIAKLVDETETLDQSVADEPGHRDKRRS